MPSSPFSIIKELHRESPRPMAEKRTKRKTHLVCKGAVKAVAPAARDRTAIDNFIVAILLLCSIVSAVTVSSDDKRSDKRGCLVRLLVKKRLVPSQRLWNYVSITEMSFWIN